MTSGYNWRRDLKTDKSFWDKSLDQWLFPTPATQERRWNFESVGIERDNFARVTRIHRDDVPVAQRPLASPPTLTNRAGRRRLYERQAIKGIGIWKQKERRHARAAAALRSERDADASDAKARTQTAKKQAELDLQWEALLRHERAAVLDALAHTFKNVPYQTLAYASSDDGALVFVAFHDFEVPSHEPDLTPTGKLTTRKLTKTERNQLYVEALAAVTINAARRALAASPGGDHAAAVSFGSAARGWGPVSWLRLLRDEDHGWAEEQWPEIALTRKGGHLTRKGRAAAVAEADFTLWPELGELTTRTTFGLAGMPPPGDSNADFTLRLVG